MTSPNRTPEDEELRHQIGVYTEAVFLHSIALGGGMTHEEAADKIFELILADRKTQAAALLEKLPAQQYYSDDGSMTYYYHDGRNKAIAEVRSIIKEQGGLE